MSVAAAVRQRSRRSSGGEPQQKNEAMTEVREGLPSLLKGSSSRKSLHSDSKEAAKDAQRAKDAAKETEKERIKAEKEKQKKDDRDRSESRISVLMGRKRGKVCVFKQHCFIAMLLRRVRADAVIRSTKEARARRYAPNADYRSSPGHSSTSGELEVWFAFVYILG